MTEKNADVGELFTFLLKLLTLWVVQVNIFILFSQSVQKNKKIHIKNVIVMNSMNIMINGRNYKILPFEQNNLNSKVMHSNNSRYR